MSQHSVTINDGGTVQVVQVDTNPGNLASLTDVNVVNKVNKSVLVFDQTTNKFVANDVNTITTITDGGSF